MATPSPSPSVPAASSLSQRGVGPAVTLTSRGRCRAAAKPPPSVGTFSELPNLAVAERPRLWGQGLYRSTPLLKNLI